MHNLHKMTPKGIFTDEITIVMANILAKYSNYKFRLHGDTVQLTSYANYWDTLTAETIRAWGPWGASATYNALTPELIEMVERATVHA